MMRHAARSCRAGESTSNFRNVQIEASYCSLHITADRAMLTPYGCDDQSSLVEFCRSAMVERTSACARTARLPAGRGMSMLRAPEVMNQRRSNAAPVSAWPQQIALQSKTTGCSVQPA